MDRAKIETRIQEIEHQIDSLYKEKYLLDTQLQEFDTDTFKEFLIGKKFRVFISDNYKFLYLVNSEFRPSQLAEHGVSGHHQSFDIADDISVSADDGDINISSTKFNKLLEFVKEYNLILDISSLQEQRDNLKSVLSLINKVLK